jgi:hypothetical protein
VAQQNRALSNDERDLRVILKRRFIGLVGLERTRKQKSSRVADLKEVDTNTRYFHLRVNAQRRKNHIHCLKIIMVGSQSMRRRQSSIITSKISSREVPQFMLS